MELGVFSVYDSQAKAYSQPFYATNSAIACRMIEDVLEDSNHPFSKHSADFTLFHIANFDDSTGLYG